MANKFRDLVLLEGFRYRILRMYPIPEFLLCFKKKSDNRGQKSDDRQMVIYV